MKENKQNVFQTDKDHSFMNPSELHCLEDGKKMQYAEKQSASRLRDWADLGLFGLFDQEHEVVDFILNYKVLFLPFEILLQEKSKKETFLYLTLRHFQTYNNN